MSKIVLDDTSPAIQYLCKKDKRLEKVIHMVGPIRYETETKDPYAFLVHEIIEQMLSIKAGAKIYSRLQDICNGEIIPERISQLTDEQIKNIGTSNAKVTYIRSLTEKIMSGEIDLENLKYLDDKEVYKQLVSLRGIGSWTAKMYLIFVLDRQDILPYEDVAFLQSYEWVYKTKNKSKDSIIKKCKKWKPYSSIAARYLYRALDTGLTKEEFHLYKQEETDGKS